MSVFSMIKRGRQAAKEHNASKREQEKKENEKTPYKHVPSHAAIDAMNGAPSTWRDDDRPRILEQNRRRSAMTANGVGMSGVVTPIHTGMPRTYSALSHVSYPSVYASPVVQMPRNYSQNSMYPGWNNNGGEIVYSHVAPSVSSSLKGKEVERVVYMDHGHSSQSSRSSSNLSTSRTHVEPGKSILVKPQATSPVGSSSNSTSSQDDLEMKPVKHTSKSAEAKSGTPAASTPSQRPTSEMDYFSRSHGGHTRRTSDPSKHDRSRPPQAYYNSQKPPRITSLPVSPTGVPPVPLLPMQVGSAASHYTTAPAVETAPMMDSAASWANSINFVQHSNSSSSSSLSNDASTVRANGSERSPVRNADLASPPAAATVAPAVSHQTPRIPRGQTRFTEIETPMMNNPAPVHYSTSTARSYHVVPAPGNENYVRDPRHENSRQSYHPENHRQSSYSQDTSRRQSHHQESSRNMQRAENFKQESNGYDPMRQNYFRAGSLRKDNFRHDLHMDNSAQQENYLPEPSRRESWRPDHFNQEPLGQEGSFYQDPQMDDRSRRESMRQDHYSPQAVRRESLQPAETFKPVPVPVTGLPTSFQLPAHGNMNVAPPQKTGKLTKNPGGAKLAKKNRWSFRSSTATPVAAA